MWLCVWGANFYPKIFFFLTWCHFKKARLVCFFFHLSAQVLQETYLIFSPCDFPNTNIFESAMQHKTRWSISQGGRFFSGKWLNDFIFLACFYHLSLCTCCCSQHTSWSPQCIQVLAGQLWYKSQKIRWVVDTNMERWILVLFCGNPLFILQLSLLGLAPGWCRTNSPTCGLP